MHLCSPKQVWPKHGMYCIRDGTFWMFMFCFVGRIGTWDVMPVERFITGPFNILDILFLYVLSPLCSALGRYIDVSFFARSKNRFLFRFSLSFTCHPDTSHISNEHDCKRLAWKMLEIYLDTLRLDDVHAIQARCTPAVAWEERTTRECARWCIILPRIKIPLGSSQADRRRRFFLLLQTTVETNSPGGLSHKQGSAAIGLKNLFLKWFFYIFVGTCFICRPSESTV